MITPEEKKEMERLMALDYIETTKDNAEDIDWSKVDKAPKE